MQPRHMHQHAGWAFWMRSPDIEGSGGDTTPSDTDAPVEVADKPREPTTYEKQLRTKLSNSSKRAEEAERKLTEAESRFKADADKAIAEHRTASEARLVRAELKAAALKAGIVDLDGLKLLDISGVKLDEHGEVAVPEDFFERARKSKPWLFATTGADRGNTSHPADPPKRAADTNRSAKDMSPAEFKAAMAKIARGESV